MADLAGSSRPRPHLQLSSPAADAEGRPQVLRPAPNRHFPLPSSAVFPGLDRANAAAAAAVAAAVSAEKPKFLHFGSPAAVAANLTPITKIEDHIDQIVQRETEQGNKEEIKARILTDISSPDAKRPKTRKAPKNKRSMPQEIGSVDGISLDPSAANNCRYDSSLSLLTKKFVNLLQQTEDGTLDLNKAAEILEVQKRRIYDITNVLEGVGLLEKSLKNRIRWKGNDALGPLDLENQLDHLKVANETLYKEECRLDERIREMQENLTELTEGRSRKFLHLTYEAINSLPCFQNSTLIAIEAPHGTSIEVPDPDEDLDFPEKRYEMYVRSSMGPINCCLISENSAEAPNQDDQPTPMELSIENSGNTRDDASCSHLEDNDNTILCQSQDQETPKISSDPVNSQEGIMRIIPPDCDVNDDYWFQSDWTGSLTDIWNK
ncbi:transcription factor E2FB-like [Iris pallida]|uniref:Transcription factor E2FB-like n=1 Tax=Iris pallida TaxID=29817 RepID=A0AAX6I8E8_IRIPA|nr:transcription factor E2FB-like [Iris pallida]